jgi:hypothetical protein
LLSKHLVELRERTVRQRRRLSSFNGPDRNGRFEKSEYVGDDHDPIGPS